MTDKKRHALSSRELLERIGLGEDSSRNLLLDDEPLDSPLDDLGVALRQRFESLNDHHRFAPGDLVCWKPGLRNRRWPLYGKPAVVLEVLPAPVFDMEKDSGDAYFREPLDVVLGMFVEGGPCRGDFVGWHFDSRRFQPWKSEE